MKANGNRRERGAYYTPVKLARFVADWAIRSGTDRVLDPAAGHGRLIAAAVRRSRASEAKRSPNVWGVELHPGTFAELARRCAGFGIPPSQLRNGDFFDTPQGVGKFDVVITNPPYVRHHEIPARATTRMRAALGADGPTMDGRSSSWAYFVIRSMQLLRTGGRLAAILPGELLSADYGRRIMERVSEHFDRTIIVSCEGELFGDVQLTTLAILGDGYADIPRRAETIYGCSIQFDQKHPVLPCVGRMVQVRDTRRATAALCLGATPQDIQFVRTAAQCDGLYRLGEVGSLAIGYVTGDNRFFHFTEAERNQVELPEAHVRRVVHRASHVHGSIVRREDWEGIRDAGKQCWLFHPQDDSEESVHELITKGSETDVRTRMKCRTRKPWWRVALGSVPEAVFVYLGNCPRIVENRARVYAANSFFTLTELRAPTASLAAASLTSVFQLSALVASRRLGGGLRKLQVGDVAALPIPKVVVSDEEHNAIDLLVRGGAQQEAIRLADEIVLKGQLGWPDLQIKDWQERLKRLSS